MAGWNIQWLGTPEKRTGNAKDHPQTAGDLAKYLRYCDVDVLALSEIEADHSDEETNKTLREALGLLNSNSGSSWEHILFPNEDGKTTQCTGVAWNAEVVTMIGVPVEIDVPHTYSAQGGTLWKRDLYATKFSAGDGKTDFYVLPLHLKADWQGDYSAHRNEEVEALVDILDEIVLELKDFDLIFIGDSNAGSSQEPGMALFRSVGWRDLNGHDYPTHFETGYGALDRVFVPAMERSEFQQQKAWVHRYDFLDDSGWSASEFRKRCSDHFMISARVTVVADDD